MPRIPKKKTIKYEKIDKELVKEVTEIEFNDGTTNQHITTQKKVDLINQTKTRIETHTKMLKTLEKQLTQIQKL